MESEKMKEEDSSQEIITKGRYKLTKRYMEDKKRGRMDYEKTCQQAE